MQEGNREAVRCIVLLARWRDRSEYRRRPEPMDPCEEIVVRGKSRTLDIQLADHCIEIKQRRNVDPLKSKELESKNHSFSKFNGPYL